MKEGLDGVGAVSHAVRRRLIALSIQGASHPTRTTPKRSCAANFAKHSRVVAWGGGPAGHPRHHLLGAVARARGGWIGKAKAAASLSASGSTLIWVRPGISWKRLVTPGWRPSRSAMRAPALDRARHLVGGRGAVPVGSACWNGANSAS